MAIVNNAFRDCNKMKMLLLVYVNVVLIVGDTQFGAASTKECVLDELKIKPNQSIPHPTRCLEIHCIGGPDNYYIRGCGYLLPNRGCKPKINFATRYPDCCNEDKCL